MPQAAGTAKNSRLLMLASIAVIVAALYFAKEVLVPLALAVMFSFLLTPLVTRLQRLGLNRIGAVVVVVTLLALALGTLGWIVYGQIGDLAGKLEHYKSNIEEKVTWAKRFTSGGPLDKATNVLKNSLEHGTTRPTTVPTTQSATQPAAIITGEPGTGQAMVPVNPTTQPVNPLPVFVTNQPTDANPFKNFYQSFSPLLEPLGTFGIILVFVIFMLVAREDLRDRVIRLIGQGRINITTQAMDEAATRVSRYLIAQCIVNGTYGLAIGIGLWVIGMTFGHAQPSFPNAFLWGLLTALLRFIPYIGPWIGAAFPILISLAVYPGMAVPMAVIGMFLVIELLSNNLMEPWLYGSSTGVSAVAVLVAAVFWTWLWGTAGLLLSTPLTVIIVVMGKYVPQLEFLNVLLGDEPALEPRYRLYQRLLAEDQEEAQELTEEYLKERSLVEVYDTVVLPALSLSEADWHAERLDERKLSVVRAMVREMVDEIGPVPGEIADPGAPEPAASPGSGNGAGGGGAAAATGDGGPATAPATTLAKAAAIGAAKVADTAEDTTALTGTAAVDKAAAPAEPPKVEYERCVVTIPARDPADELGAMMLTQVLLRHGYCARYISVEKLASEYVQIVQEMNVQVVIISALPPAASTHARYIVKRLRQKLPDLKILVGLWTSCGEMKRPRERLKTAGTDLVVGCLADALAQLRQVVEPLLLEERAAAAAAQKGEERKWRADEAGVAARKKEEK